MKQSKNLLHKTQGFTLIELLVAMAILAMVLVGLFIMLSSILRVRNNHNVDQQLNAEGNHAMNRIEFLIRNGITMPSICCPNAGQPCTGSGVTRTEISSITEEGRGDTQKTYHRNIIDTHEGNIRLRTFLVGGGWVSHGEKALHCGPDFDGRIYPDATLSEVQLLSPGIRMDGLTFHCDVEAGGRINQSAIVTVNFSLALDLDTLGELEAEVEEHFERRIVIANNFNYVCH